MLESRKAMSCCPCLSSQTSESMKSKREDSFQNLNDHSTSSLPERDSVHTKTQQSLNDCVEKKKKKKAGAEMKMEKNKAEKGNIAAENFTFRELAAATNNFRQECLLGEGGFGRVYKGTLKSTNQVVAVKQLDRNGLQGNKEFLVEVLMLSLLHHPNLVNLVGYCAEGDQRLLVYEFMSNGSLEDHLLEDGEKTLDWHTRIKIASGAARGLEYLHDKADPPVIFRDLKSSNILLDSDYNPKLSDFGLAKLGPIGDKVHVSSRIMGTYGYCAPEYARTGDLTLKSDVYSFGVVLLELVTGKRAIDTTRPSSEQNLVGWAQPLFRDPKKYPEMADPQLQGNFPEKDLNQAVAIAAMCLQEEASVRPLMSDVVIALSFLSSSLPPSLFSPDHLPHEEDKNSDSKGEEEEAEKDDEEEAAKKDVEMQDGCPSSPICSYRSENESFSSTHARRSSKVPEDAMFMSRNSSLNSRKSVFNGGSVVSHSTSKADSDRRENGSSWGSEEESAYSFSPNRLMKSLQKKEGSQSGKNFSHNSDNDKGSESRTGSF